MRTFEHHCQGDNHQGLGMGAEAVADCHRPAVAQQVFTQALLFGAAYRLHSLGEGYTLRLCHGLAVD